MKINQKLKTKDFKNTHKNLLKGPRALFETKEAQRAFFVSVKKKLEIGARNISKIIGLKSRGPLENYTSARSAPTVAIVKKLEELSGIKTDYDVVEGIVKRQKRGLTPLKQKEAEHILRGFGKNYPLIIHLIKEGLTIETIEQRLREIGHVFDSSPVARAIGTIRTNLRIRFVQDIDTKDHIIVSGYVRNIRGSSYVNFHLDPFVGYIVNKKPKIAFIVKKNRGLVKLVPLEKIGRKLSCRVGKILSFNLPLHLNLEHKSNVQIAFLPSDFGLDYLSFIADEDGKKLAELALKRGIEISPIRSTYTNHFGDIVFLINNKQYIIEITRANSKIMTKFKLGQLLIQTVENPNSEHILVCKSRLFSKTNLKALKHINVKLIESNFSKEWEKTVLEKILEIAR